MWSEEANNQTHVQQSCRAHKWIIIHNHAQRRAFGLKDDDTYNKFVDAIVNVVFFFSQTFALHIHAHSIYVVKIALCVTVS